MMRKNQLATVSLMAVSFLFLQALHAQTAEQLKGIWINQTENRKTEFYTERNAYFGKLVWAADESKVKEGQLLFKDLEWDGKQFVGKVVTPARGEARCSVSFEGADKLRITVSKGGMSRAVYWTRVK